VTPGKVIHAILDNYATHKHPKVAAWLARHPRWVFHFTPPSPPGSTPSRASSPFTRGRRKRGSFASTAELKAAIARFIREHNNTPKPFVWTQSQRHPRQTPPPPCSF
jgi:transposase